MRSTRSKTKPKDTLPERKKYDNGKRDESFNKLKAIEKAKEKTKIKPARYITRSKSNEIKEREEKRSKIVKNSTKWKSNETKIKKMDKVAEKNTRSKTRKIKAEEIDDNYCSKLRSKKTKRNLDDANSKRKKIKEEKEIHETFQPNNGQETMCTRSKTFKRNIYIPELRKPRMAKSVAIFNLSEIESVEKDNHSSKNFKLIPKHKIKLENAGSATKLSPSINKTNNRMETQEKFLGREQRPIKMENPSPSTMTSSEVHQTRIETATCPKDCQTGEKDLTSSESIQIEPPSTSSILTQSYPENSQFLMRSNFDASVGENIQEHFNSEKSELTIPLYCSCNKQNYCYASLQKNMKVHFSSKKRELNIPVCYSCKGLDHRLVIFASAKKTQNSLLQTYISGSDLSFFQINAPVWRSEFEIGQVVFSANFFLAGGNKDVIDYCINTEDECLTFDYVMPCTEETVLFFHQTIQKNEESCVLVVVPNENTFRSQSMQMHNVSSINARLKNDSIILAQTRMPEQWVILFSQDIFMSFCSERYFSLSIPRNSSFLPLILFKGPF